MNDLSEDDVSVKFITPAIARAGWDAAPPSHWNAVASM